jgi:hypothetical protein
MIALIRQGQIEPENVHPFFYTHIWRYQTRVFRWRDVANAGSGYVQAANGAGLVTTLLWTIAPVNADVCLNVQWWTTNAIAIPVHAQRKLVIPLAQAFVTHGTPNDVTGFQGKESQAD